MPHESDELDTTISSITSTPKRGKRKPRTPKVKKSHPRVQKSTDNVPEQVEKPVSTGEENAEMEPAGIEKGTKTQRKQKKNWVYVEDDESSDKLDESETIYEDGAASNSINKEKVIFED